MLKKLVILSMGGFSSITMAANSIELHNAPLSSLKKFSIIQPTLKATSATLNDNQLLTLNQTDLGSKKITRYQQLYKGIPVIGAQVIITQNRNASLTTDNATQTNGRLLEEIEVNTQAALLAKDALEIAKKDYFASHLLSNTENEEALLQIRPADNKTLELVYQVSFKSAQTANQPAWPFYIINAQTGAIVNQWDNIKNYNDTGPGGNEKTHEYWYGKDGLPALNVIKKGENCIMDDTKVRLVNLHLAWDWYDKMMTSYKYACDNNEEEVINGAYSPTDDAYYFGHVIIDMYKKWYSLNALQNSKGSPMTLVMRVHFGENYDNAFWDGKAMSFGDGDDFYPLVSLDVAGHEVSHGFTEQHSGLEYHDQSGALNESFSDMAGQASRAYLLETNPYLYGKTNIKPDEVTWGLGETIVKDSFGSKALRFMDFPSSDGHSADCVDKSLAGSTGTYCAISYDELVAYAKQQIPNLQQRQSFIVHTASGVFNKAFYLLSQQIGIKKAFNAMLIANSKYWTPTENFAGAACGVIYAANDLKMDTTFFKQAFDQVGIATTHCNL